MQPGAGRSQGEGDEDRQQTHLWVTTRPPHASLSLRVDSGSSCQTLCQGRFQVVSLLHGQCCPRGPPVGSEGPPGWLPSCSDSGSPLSWRKGRHLVP